MSREEAAREALSMLAGHGREDRYDSGIEQKGEASTSRSFVGPSYQRQLPPLRSDSNGGVDVRNHSLMRSREDSASQTLYFGERSGSAVQMTASPTTSPSLVPIRSPRPLEHSSSSKARRSPFDGLETDRPASAFGDRVLHRPRPQRRGPAVSDMSGLQTPGSLDMPSLCSSTTSSGTDQFGTASRSAWHESRRSSQPYTPMSEIGSLSHADSPGNRYFADRTDRPLSDDVTPSATQHADATSREDRRRIEAIRRVAIAFSVAPEVIQRALEKRLASTEEAMQEVEGRDADVEERDDPPLTRRLVEAVHQEERHLAHLDAQRASTTRAERSQSDMTNVAGPSTSSGSFARGTPYSPRQTREYCPPRYTQSHTMPPLSPPPAYDSLDRVHLPHPRASPASIPSLWEGVPPARMALESLGGPSGSMSPHAGPGAFSPQPRQLQSIHPTGPAYGFSALGAGSNEGAHHLHQAYGRRDSAPRPLVLPDRSYRSMDDYAGGIDAAMSPDAQAHLSQASSLSTVRSPLRRSIVRTNSDQDARPVYVGSPGEADDRSPARELREIVSMGGDTGKRAAASSNYHDAAQRGPKRRATGGDLLGLAMPRSSSPMRLSDTVDDGYKQQQEQQKPTSGPSKTPRTRNGRGKAATMPVKPIPLKLNHDEVMARLQRKVKERIAARQASSSSSVAALGNFTGDAAGSDVSLFSASSLVTSPPSSPVTTGQSLAADNAKVARRSSQKATPLRATPQRTMSVDTMHTSSAAASPSAQALRSGVNGTIPENGRETSATPRKDEAASRLGIEALLSAAAIADSPRAG